MSQDSVSNFPTNLPNGFFFVENGKAIEVERFSWGDEGYAPCNGAHVNIVDGATTLIYGPGSDKVGEVIRGPEGE